MAQKSTRVIVIGAGWNGISAAKTYLQIDPTIDLKVLESESTLGGTWSSARIYPELLSQQPYGQYEATDFPMEQRDPDAPAGFIPSKRIHSYLEEYAKLWNISDKIRYNTTVERVRRAADGVAWLIDIKGENTSFICDKLIIATGLTSTPNLPEIPTSNFSPLTFHSRYLGEHHATLRSLDVRVITVYGGGKSAYDAANAAMKAGKRVQWVIRTSGEGIGLMIDATKLTKRMKGAAWVPAASALQMEPLHRGWSYWFFHSGKNFLGYWLMWKFWDLASANVLSQWDFDENENMAKLKPKFTDRAMFWGIPAPFPVPGTELIDKIRNGDGVEVYRADIIRLDGRTLHLSDGTELETDVLIHATGYAAQQTIFSLEDAYELGLPVPFRRLPALEAKPGSYIQRSRQMDEEVLRRFPRLAQCPSKYEQATYTQYRLYRSILPLSLLEKQDRSLAFVGYLRGMGISVIADISALWAVAWLSGQMDLTRDLEEVEWEVDFFNAFIRNRHGKKGAEIPTALFEWVSSTNAMLSDLGMPLPNVSKFRPWLPKVYRGLAENWKRSRANGGRSGSSNSSRGGIDYRLLGISCIGLICGVGLLLTRSKK